MTLYTQLQTARSEEDVKDAYIKALGLKGYTKGLIEIPPAKMQPMESLRPDMEIEGRGCT